jgi:cadmium resistance transport/sequestration family protein
MIQTFMSAVVVYISTSIDDLFILMVIFGQIHSKKGMFSIWRGQYAGVGILVVTSLLAAFALNLIPQSWIIGLLGLAPITLGFRALRKEPEENDMGVLEKINAVGHQRLFWTMTLITVASGGDNLGVYIPYFVSLDYVGILIATVVFLVMIALFCLIGQRLARIPLVAKVLETYSRIIIPVVFFSLGIFILIENGTVEKLWSLFV